MAAPKTRNTSLSDEAVSQLKALYKAGMVRTGKNYSSLIQLSCSKTGLTIGQVQVRTACTA